MSIRLRAQGKKNMEGDVKREFKVYGFSFLVSRFSFMVSRLAAPGIRAQGKNYNH
jgi:hypothetical protein